MVEFAENMQFPSVFLHVRDKLGGLKLGPLSNSALDSKNGLLIAKYHGLLQ